MLEHLLAVWLGLVILTGPDGRSVWINPSNVVAIRSVTQGEAPSSARAAIVTVNGGIVYVKETPEFVADALKD